MQIPFALPTTTHFEVATNTNAPAQMWPTTAEQEAPCPVETEEVRQRYPKQLLMTAPWCVVVNQLWGLAFAEPKYLQEVPIVVKEVEAARALGLHAAR